VSDLRSVSEGILLTCSLGRHEAFVTSNCDQVIRDPATGQEFSLSKGEMVEIEHSHKVGFIKCSSILSESLMYCPVLRQRCSYALYCG
jgi:hypothetical protein